MRTIYQLKESTMEVKLRKVSSADDIISAFFAQSDISSKTIKEFYDKEAALKTLSEYESSTSEFNSPIGKMLDATLYFLEEFEAEEDDDCSDYSPKGNYEFAEFDERTKKMFDDDDEVARSK